MCIARPPSKGKDVALFTVMKFARSAQPDRKKLFDGGSSNNRDTESIKSRTWNAKTAEQGNRTSGGAQPFKNAPDDVAAKLGLPVEVVQPTLGSRSS